MIVLKADLKYLHAKISRKGGARANQDSVRHGESNGVSCWVLADGVGGYAGGAEASRIATDSMAEALAKASPAATPDLCGQLMNAGHQAMLEEKTRRIDLQRMAAAGVVLVADGQSAAWAHIGDCRLYFFREGTLQFVTLDHSSPGERRRAGEATLRDIRADRSRNQLLSMLGDEYAFRPEIIPSAMPLAVGDAFLLASDGFWEYLSEECMEIDLAKSSSPEEWLARLERRRLDLATLDSDNYSAIAVWCEGASGIMALPRAHDIADLPIPTAGRMDREAVVHQPPVEQSTRTGIQRMLRLLIFGLVIVYLFMIFRPETLGRYIITLSERVMGKAIRTGKEVKLEIRKTTAPK